MLVMDMIIVAVVGVRTIVTVMEMMRGHCQRGLRPACLQRADEAAALGPDQTRTECRDQRVTADLYRLLGAAHGLCGGIQQPGSDTDDQDRDQRLHQR